MTAESYKKQAANRRDERNAKGTITAPGGSSRSTRRWCKGKIGQAHTLTVTLFSALKRASYTSAATMYKGWLVRYCTTCGKEVDRYYPMPGWPKRRPAPEWAFAYYIEHPEHTPEAA